MYNHMNTHMHMMNADEVCGVVAVGLWCCCSGLWCCCSWSVVLLQWSVVLLQWSVVLLQLWTDRWIIVQH